MESNIKNETKILEQLQKLLEEAQEAEDSQEEKVDAAQAVFNAAKDKLLKAKADYEEANKNCLELLALNAKEAGMVQQLIDTVKELIATGSDEESRMAAIQTHAKTAVANSNDPMVASLLTDLSTSRGSDEANGIMGLLGKLLTKLKDESCKKAVKEKFDLIEPLEKALDEAEAKLNAAKDALEELKTKTKVAEKAVADQQEELSTMQQAFNKQKMAVANQEQLKKDYEKLKEKLAKCKNKLDQCEVMDGTEAKPLNTCYGRSGYFYVRFGKEVAKGFCYAHGWFRIDPETTNLAAYKGKGEADKYRWYPKDFKYKASDAFMAAAREHSLYTVNYLRVYCHNVVMWDYKNYNARFKGTGKNAVITPYRVPYNACNKNDNVWRNTLFQFVNGDLPVKNIQLRDIGHSIESYRPVPYSIYFRQAPTPADGEGSQKQPLKNCAAGKYGYYYLKAAAGLAPEPVYCSNGWVRFHRAMTPGVYYGHSGDTYKWYFGSKHQPGFSYSNSKEFMAAVSAKAKDAYQYMSTRCHGVVMWKHAGKSTYDAKFLGVNGKTIAPTSVPRNDCAKNDNTWRSNQFYFRKGALPIWDMSVKDNENRSEAWQPLPHPAYFKL